MTKAQSPPMAITIRPVSQEDVAPIHALYADEVLHGFANYEYEPPSPQEMARRIDAILAAGYPWLVAELDGAFAGYAYASAFRSRAGYRYTVENTVYVHPRAQRRGVARGLMTVLIERCTALGFRQMIAVIGDADNAASIALHRGLGFEQVAVFRGIGYKALGDGSGRWLDNVQMQRALAEDARSPPLPATPSANIAAASAAAAHEPTAFPPDTPRQT
jgi:L-amino acid N-acyltransferase YncA